jgi:hypothetical protein
MNEPITIIPMTLFEAYLTVISGTYVCKPTKYETIESKVIKHWEDE